jgi:hypothetical protein
MPATDKPDQWQQPSFFVQTIPLHCDTQATPAGRFAEERTHKFKSISKAWPMSALERITT